MSTTIAPPIAVTPLVDALGRETPELARTKTAPILVATDGETDSDAALRIARLLATRLGRRLELVTVDEAAPNRVSGFVLPARSLLEDLVRDAGPLVKVRQQANTILGPDGWRVHVEFGSVPANIVHVADDELASLIVMGIGKHTPAERLFGAETVARVLREAEVPVLAVHPSATKLPTRAAVGLDFSPTSLRAARAAVEVLDRPATLLLVHVASGAPPEVEKSAGWNRIYATGLSGMFDDLVKELARDGLTIETRMLEGRVTQQLEKLAETEKLDLIAVGSHGPRMIERLLLGGVPQQLLRTAGCSVLVATPKKMA